VEISSQTLRTRPLGRELTLDRLLRDAIELMGHLDCASAHIVGNSAALVVSGDRSSTAASDALKYANLMKPEVAHDAQSCMATRNISDVAHLPDLSNPI
jgi:hypothetical protein